MHRKLKKVRYWINYNLPAIGSVLVLIAVIALIVLGIIDEINDVPVLEYGRVTDMTFTEARTDTEFYTTTDGDGNVTTHSWPVRYPNKWQIQVVGNRENGKARSEWWDVGEGMYEQIGIGDDVHRNAKLGVVSIIRKAVAEDAQGNR